MSVVTQDTSSLKPYVDNNKVEKDHLRKVKVANHQKAKNVILDSELRAGKSSEK